MTTADAPLTLDLPDAERFEQLAAELRLAGSAAETRTYREAYFDTPEGTLLGHGVTCSLRIEKDRPSLLVVAAPEPAEAGGAAIQRRFETPVLGAGVYETLRGPSEAALRIQQLVEPGTLRTRIAVDVELRTRTVHSRWLLRPLCELRLARTTIQSGGVVRVLHELAIRPLRGDAARPAEIAARLQQRYGLRPAPAAPPLQRVLDVLSDVEVELTALRPRPPGARVAVLALDQGTIALVRCGAGLRLPIGEGSGRRACLRLVEQTFAGAVADVRLLGTARAGRDNAAELWLARGVRRPPGDDTHDGNDDDRPIWPRLDAVIERLGTPALRDRVTLSALTLAARAGLVDAGAGVVDAGRTASGDDAADPLPAVSPAAEEASGSDAELFLNEELSFLDFDQRVLELAEDPRTPLLERLRFLAIFASNLDEFFMVRVGGLKRDLAEGDGAARPDGLGPEELLALLSLRVRALVARQQRCLREQCRPALAERGIRILRWDELDESQRAYLAGYFDRQVFPVLTPHALTISPGHPFPHIPNFSLSVAVALREPGRSRPRFAHLRVPDHLPRFVPLPGERAFVLLEDVLGAHVDALFPGLGVEEVHPFRVIRSGDVHLEEDRAASLLDVLEEEVQRRPFKEVVRVEVDHHMPGAVRELLLRELREQEPAETAALREEDIQEVDGPLDLRALGEIGDLPDPELHFPRFHAATPGADRPIFELLAERDLLVHHPYDSFEATVQRFFGEAAEDPAVLAIKLTLYRAGKQSPIGDALLRAAECGKEVSVFVELKARFDEERNIEWARRLEHSGIHVVYGLVGLKTHSKVALVVRREGDTLRRYAHIGTGNYNAATARVYTDLGLLTADPALGADLSDLFNELTGTSRAPNREYRRLVVAPGGMLAHFLRLIEREVEHAREGRGGHIRAKLNGLTDAEIIQALYRASQAGVEIDLSVRGICALRPGIGGLSDRIRVRSILGRFLEHARIYAFANGGSPEYYIGSADWRERNLRRRVEVVAPVSDPTCRTRLETILQLELEDPTAWALQPDGSYARPPSDGCGRSAQDRLVERAAGAVPPA